MNCYDLIVTADMTPTPPPSSKRTAHGRETMTQLPLVRVKRIIKVDRDIQKCGNEAAMLITRATELFVQYLAEQGFHFAKTENRKTVQYKDLANAVARIDQLAFLSDIVPRTLTYKKAIQQREQFLAAPDSPEHNGSSSEWKRSRTSARDRESGGRGGIERFFKSSQRNGILEDEASVEEDRMDVDE